MPKCTGHKRNGEPCHQNAMKGSTKCRLHGGATPRGLASPNLKHGRYSKYLPMPLQEKYQTAIHDKELLNLDEDIALLDTRLADILSRVGNGESGELWTHLRESKLALLAARRENNTQAVNLAMNRLLSLIDTGVQDAETWGEIRELLEQRRKLVESERKRRIDMQEMVTAEQATFLFTALASVVRQVLKDDYDRLTQIQTQFALYTQGVSYRSVDAGTPEDPAGGNPDVDSR